MKKILFPYEKGVENKNAFIHAARIAHKTGAELIILHAFTFQVDDDISDYWYKINLKKKWLEIVDEISILKTAYIAKHHESDGQLGSTFKLSYQVIFGEITAEIRKVLSREHIDLLVLTVPFIENNDVKLSGNNLKSIIDASRCSLLLIPEHAEYSTWKEVGYAINFQKIKGNTTLIKFVQQFSKLFGAKLRFIHVSRDGKLNHIEDHESYCVIEELIRSNDDQYSLEVITATNAIDAIDKYINEQKVDLVAVVKQHRSFLENMFHESFTNQIGIYAKSPLLIMYEKIEEINS